MAGLAGLVLAALPVAACTTQDEPQADPTAGPARTPTPSETSPSPQHDEPLVVAVHHGSPLRDIPLRRARAIVDGGADDDETFTVVPASALGPRMRALLVDGVDPVRSPEEYPLRTQAAGPRDPAVTVTVVGDIMLGRGVAQAARGSDHPAPALRPTSRRLAQADITVGNLENTLSRAGSPTQGGDSFAADPAVVEGLR
jgi:hypothetical protein